MMAPFTPAEVYRSGAYDGARPDPRELISDWADEFRVLTERSSPEPGPWRTSRVPYLRAPMDDLSPSSRVEVVVIMAGAQVGKTETGNNWIGYSIHRAPGPFLSVMPSVEMAKRNSKQRIQPLIEDSPVLSALVKEARSRDSGNTVLAKEFDGGILVMTGANSATGLRSMAARYLFLDEVDAYPGDIEGEGDPCDLAMARTTNFPRRKILITSTPVVSGRSRIERFYEQSDQRQFWVPCPRCGEMLVLQMANLRWPTGQPRLAKYYCEACAQPISNLEKEWMLARGQWRPRSVNEIVHGYHLPSLYSPVGWLSWGQVAERREKAGNDPEKVQVFQNTVLGLPYADASEVPDAERLFERRETYQIGVVPRGGLVLTAGVDVHPRRLEVEVVAWGRNKESWSIDYRVFEGETHQPHVWQNLSEMLEEDFATEYGQTVRIRRIAVDSGFNTMAVYDWIRKQSRQRVMAVKGQTTVPSVLGAAKLIEVGPTGSRVKFGIRLWPLNVNIAKEELYRWLRQPAPDLTRGEEWPAGYCHFPEYNKNYFEQLTAEQLITRAVGGRRVSSWEKIRDRNEALDCRIYARAAAASLRLESWKPERWDETEAVLSDPNVRTTAAVPSTGAPSAARTPVPQFRSSGPRTDWLE
jgi:phage terminase large subunit GpA-like protein